jgi:hypothetical protein
MAFIWILLINAKILICLISGGERKQYQKIFAIELLVYGAMCYLEYG